MDLKEEQNLYTQIVERAWEDARFKSDLMENPVAAIEALTGKKLDLPAGKRLVVRDQTNEGVVYINIPAKPETEDIELNEDQLEAVAGGGFWDWLTGGSSGFGGGSFGGGGAGGSW